MNEIHRTVAVELPEDFQVSEPGGAFHFFTEQADDWCWHEGAFTNDELDAIIAMGEQARLSKGRVGGGDATGIRDSYISWLFPNEITAWVFQRMAAIVQTRNAEHYGFDLDGFFQGFQFTKYVAPGQHYTWHTDRGPGHGVRKLSVSLLLSDPNDYEGGDLQMRFGDSEVSAKRERGVATLFPSWTTHRVTPVTSGTRYSLVAWVSGPPFR